MHRLSEKLHRFQNNYPLTQLYPTLGVDSPHESDLNPVSVMTSIKMLESTPSPILNEMKRVLCSGSFICDFIAVDLPGMGNPGDLIYPPGGIRLHPGGHSANVAIDLAQLGRRETAVVGGIGDDVLGRFIESELTSRGLQARPERIPGAHTAKNIVLIVKGEDRRFYAELSANTMLTPDHVLEVLRETRPEVFYQGTVGGLKRLDPEIATILTEAKSQGALTILDVVRPYPGGWDGLLDAFSLVDVFHCNGYESQVLTGETDPMKACETLIRKGAGLVTITLGPEGLIAGWGENMLRVPGFDVDSVDPTGAGDAFCAGIIDCLLDDPGITDNIRGLSVEDTNTILLNGSAAGAACVTSTGATTAVTRVNIDSLMKEQGAGVRVRILASRRRLI
jgi:sugar/nucleoside kinase (ribokinase family)